jgi:dTMP kinase
VDGVGKSTQIDMLKAYLDKTGQEAICLREPGGTSISEQIRKVLLSLKNDGMTNECELFMYAAARAQLVHEVIKPALDKGKIIICDRFTDSTIAYQGYARGLGVAHVASINDYAVKGTMPDVTVFLDYEPVACGRRKCGYDKTDRIEHQGIDFFQKVYEGYHLCSDMYQDRIVKIQPTGTKEDTHNTIILTLRGRGVIR